MIKGVSKLQTTEYTENLRSALATLIEVTLYEPNRTSSAGLCEDFDRLTTALHRAFEMRCYGDLDEPGEIALTEIEGFAAAAGLPPLPHCEGCDLKEPLWSQNLAQALQKALLSSK